MRPGRLIPDGYCLSRWGAVVRRARACGGWLAAVLACALINTAGAQTCAMPGWEGAATPSGVVNSYHAGSGSPAAGNTSITVASASGQRSNTRSLRAGDLILIIQMQDSGTPANAGTHEYAQVVAVSGSTLSLSRGLANSYAQSMNTTNVRNWQVVWVPQYSSATVSGTVSADRWSINTSSGDATVCDFERCHEARIARKNIELAADELGEVFHGRRELERRNRVVRDVVGTDIVRLLTLVFLGSVVVPAVTVVPND